MKYSNHFFFFDTDARVAQESGKGQSKETAQATRITGMTLDVM